jgi:hypothetical protein
MEKLDFNESQFFSLTMDHAYAQINVHWLSRGAQDGPFSFHVEGLLKHFLDDPIGIRAVVRAVKNILDYCSDARLRTLCKALDAYRERYLTEREAATSGRDQAYEVQTQPRKEQQRRGRPKGQPSSGRRRPELLETTTPPVEDWADGPQEKQYGGRGSRRMRTTAGRGRGEQTSPETRNQTNLSVKATHTSSRRASARAARVTEYDR